MSEPKIISPLLDGFSVGAPVSEHDGVRCCPAIKENSDEKYIVKIISIPPSQAHMDALLLAGAYRDAEGAMQYYQQLSEDILEEARFLKDLSRLDGFTPYENWQMEPITKHRLGYEVYLLGTYKRSLEKVLRKKPFTHLDALNLALDICAAFNVSRQAGAIYADLKPGNIFVTENGQYRIGDLGFIRLDALKYTALPTKYRSAYSPPELSDPMESVGLTVDTYALGMILYQLYNEGALPSCEADSQVGFAPPAHADYELSEIILKALDPDPANRWQDPAQMGQALVSYMQRNGVEDVPITPYTPIDIDTQDVQIPRDEPAPIIPEIPELLDEAGEKPVSEPVQSEASESDGTGPVEAGPEAAADAPAPEAEPEPPAEAEHISETAEPEEASDSSVQADAPDTDPAPAAPDTDPVPAAVAAAQTGKAAQTQAEEEPLDELSRIFAKVDDLIAHETPAGVVLPEIPEPPDPFGFATEDSIEAADLQTPFDPVMEPVKEYTFENVRKQKEKKHASERRKKKVKQFFGNVLLFALLAGLCYGGFWCYQNVFLKTVESLTISGTQESLTVEILTNADEADLSVTCADTYGNVYTSAVKNGKASFSKLVPNTMYTVTLDIEGFHSLVGKTSDVFTTEATTKVLSFTAIAGPEDGSVILNFSVEGEDPRYWKIFYSADGEDTKYTTLDSHTTTVSGLTLGKVYTFWLDAGEKLSLSGEDRVTFLASRLILAKNLTMTTGNGNDLTIRWTSPGDTVVDSWKVRCYNSSGYDKTVSVSDTEVLLPDIDPNLSYTVEVTAAGMTQPARASITKNPIRVTELSTDASDPNVLKVTWEYSGDAPEEGWLLMYRIDSNANLNIVRCDSASATITPKIPGANYQFTMQTVEAISVFDNVQSYDCPEAAPFQANKLAQENITLNLVSRPEDPNWNYDQLGSSAFTDQFASGEPISLVLQADTDFYLPGSECNVLYVIRDSHGYVVPDYVSQTQEIWSEIWQSGSHRFGELDLPAAPTNPGSYELSLYIDGAFAGKTEFTVQ